MDDALLRLVLVGTTALPSFGLGVWAGARARDRSRKTSLSSSPEIPSHELAVERARAVLEEPGAPSLVTPMLPGRAPPLGELRPLRPAAEQRAHPNQPGE